MAGRPRRTWQHRLVPTLELVDPEGAVLGDASIDPTAEPLPRAIVVSRPDADPIAVADAVVDQLRGHRISSREGEVADALLARGAELVRASSLMVLALPAAPTGVGSADVRPLRDVPEEYGEVIRAAYPPDHPDHEMMEATPAGAAATVRGYLDGSIVGPLLREASAEARDANGALAGLIIISTMPADGEYEGSPWITDLCVDPAAQGQGLGRALLTHAIDRLGAEGHAALGLAVTQGSPARQLYEAMGFVERFPAWTLTLT
jgi:GNAT superfamily N-acetyltransferase